MQKSTIRRYAVAPVLLACWIGAPGARAADEAPAAKPRVVILCPECGMVYNIRRIEKPVAPERNLLPSLASAPHAGGTGNETRAVPLFSIGAGGPQRVQREPVTRSVWEVTVRYDNGTRAQGRRPRAPSRKYARSAAAARALSPPPAPRQPAIYRRGRARLPS